MATPIPLDGLHKKPLDPQSQQKANQEFHAMCDEFAKTYRRQPSASSDDDDYDDVAADVVDEQHIIGDIYLSNHGLTVTFRRTRHTEYETPIEEEYAYSPAEDIDDKELAISLKYSKRYLIYVGNDDWVYLQDSTIIERFTDSTHIEILKNYLATHTRARESYIDESDESPSGPSLGKDTALTVDNQDMLNNLLHAIVGEEIDKAELSQMVSSVAGENSAAFLKKLQDYNYQFTFTQTAVDIVNQYRQRFTMDGASSYLWQEPSLPAEEANSTLMALAREIRQVTKELLRTLYDSQK